MRPGNLASIRTLVMDGIRNIQEHSSRRSPWVQTLTDGTSASTWLRRHRRPESNSSYFNQLKDSISRRPITEGGTLFLDRSKLYNGAFQYNFSDIIKWAKIIAGVNYRIYDLNSKGTLFPDEEGPIRVNEYSAYAQISKRSGRRTDLL